MTVSRHSIGTPWLLAVRSTEKAADGTNPPSDLNGSAEYRKHLAKVLTRRAVSAAAGG